MLLYNEFMKAQSIALLVVMGVTGCATQPVPSKVSAKPGLGVDNSLMASPDAPVVSRVTLPYTFMRHGVEIRVNSVEFSENAIQVNIALQETRGQTLDLLMATLIQARSAVGTTLTYSGYILSGKSQSDQSIHIDAHAQIPITLLYAPLPAHANSVGETFQLQFPTGKYWSSQASEG